MTSKGARRFGPAPSEATFFWASLGWGFGPLVGACLATGDRIFATGSDSISKVVLRSCGCFCLISGIQSWIERAQKPKTYCDNSSLRSYLSVNPPLVFTVRSGPVWRQDLAILSYSLQKGPATTPANYVWAFCGWPPGL